MKTKLGIESYKAHKQCVEMIRTKPATHEEEKAALILEMTSIFTLWRLFK